MKKKVLCLVAALALALTMMPASGLAANGAVIKLGSADASSVSFDE